ncbi:MAG TPA: hypothetical protein VEA17_01610 [Bordetella sp.]|nr:hypothetical protein [Bordetella sp.]
MPDSSRLPSPEEVRQRLDAFRARRGYLLPHQGAMAAALPDLQDVYGVVYKTLTLDPHHLDAFEREFVWLALLVAAREHVGTHHVDLFFRTGGNDAQADAVFRLVAWAQGHAAYEFLAEAWQAYFPASPAADSYLAGLADLLHSKPDVNPGLARLALAACHAALGHHWPLRVVLRDCYAHGVAEAKVAEALSLVLWPCGINRFLEACDVWLDLMRSGEVQPSPPFQAWAETPDQDGFKLPPRST